MSFSSLYSPNYPPYSLPSESSLCSTSSGTESPPVDCCANDWSLAAADHTDLYGGRNSARLGSTNSSHSNLNSLLKKTPTCDPLLQACSVSASTTSLTNITHVPGLGIAIPRIPQSKLNDRKSLLGYSPPSQPSESIEFLKKAANAITPVALVGLLEGEPLNVLLFDIRSDGTYRAGYIYQAIGVPVPMKKLKKTSFTLDRMITDFVLDEDLEKVARWNRVGHIVVYDNDRDGQSGTAGTAAFYLLEKFIQEGWEGQAYVLKGGINRFAECYPGKIQQISSISDDNDGCVDYVSGGNRSPGDAGGNSPGEVAYINQRDILRDWKLSSGKSLPPNRDSWDEINGIAITVPRNMGQRAIGLLPTWLLKVFEDGGSRLVAEKFRLLEKLQGQRLNGTYSVPAPHHDLLSPFKEDPARYRLAGSGVDAKNRYRDIHPYEHSRVKLLDFEDGDYINASHLSVQNGSNNYISSQAPVPAAFNGFWKMVWEQDVQFIVMLTAMEEAFRTVADRYWAPGMYGPLKLTCVSDKMILLNDIPQDAWQGDGKPNPIMHYISVRKLTLEYEAYPFSAIHMITQIQDLAWPNFGVPDDPGHILRIINYINQAVGSTPPVQYPAWDCSSPFPKPPQKPIVVQCSAGCGRSGVFCTVDAVVDQLERQLGDLKKQQEHGSEAVEILVELHDSNGDYESRRSDLDDLVENIVGHFRDERISMVQNLRQYMYCYEVALEWFRVHCSGPEREVAVA